MTLSPLDPRLAATFPPPVMEARRWLDETVLPEGLPLLNLSQAAPADPPPPPLREAMARIVTEDPAAHLYGPVLGLPELRERVAADWSRAYGGTVAPAQVAITAGCNQAFAAALTSLAGPGDAVIVPTPYYFNHKMWLDMAGIEATLLPTDADLLPDPDRAAAAITPRTRAIALVTPNNPGGVEYPAGLLDDFRDLARTHGIALIVDETYRDFHSADGAPHRLLADPEWDDTVIQLYSFSKAYRLTGHRTGAILTSPARLTQIEKWLDTVTICPPQLGQRAALWGMENLSDWLAAERSEILARRAAIADGFATLPDWQVQGCGAYFAYVRHPFETRSDAVARDLLAKRAVLVLPGTMFGPLRDQGGDGRAETTLRIAFANADRDGISDLIRRLAG
ncbi:aminotransferase [Jannaschia aquimarina]|uniref:aspartate transaminase n=1 Tax=Jannaschia aquimarina TaxID=935700 RepID=A0A0D1ENY5_9RHOB|nr:aminotransferase [Jannaschia aquimarina]KIT17350.1 Aspartate aminotransferase [Jannaschia aquimarina]SNT20735.1 Aspartate/methionine/tyrosine aminotransferase [Jannaschia aquimarina]